MSYNTPRAEHWWDTHDNVVLVAYWMQERDHGVDDFVSLIEKPWKWTTEYEQACADQEAEESQALFDQDVIEASEAIDEQAKLEQEFRAGFEEARAPEGFIKPVFPPKADNERPT